MIGGALLLNSISSMFGHHGGSAFGAVPPASGSPWDNSAANSDLARDAGVTIAIGRAHQPPGCPDSCATTTMPTCSTGGGDLRDIGADFGGDFGGDSA